MSEVRPLLPQTQQIQNAYKVGDLSVSVSLRCSLVNHNVKFEVVDIG